MNRKLNCDNYNMPLRQLKIVSRQYLCDSCLLFEGGNKRITSIALSATNASSVNKSRL